MSHYYYFAFIESKNGREEVRSAVNIGLTQQKVSRKVIQGAKSVAGASPDSVMTCCTYLGEMTKEEFNDA